PCRPTRSTKSPSSAARDRIKQTQHKLLQRPRAAFRRQLTSASGVVRHGHTRTSKLNHAAATRAYIARSARRAPSGTARTGLSLFVSTGPMASHGGHDHDALWAKLWELELQLAAYKLLHAARRGEEDDADADGVREPAGAGACRRGRQYDAYMRRRDARRVSVAAVAKSQQQQQQRPSGVSVTRAGGRPSPLTVRCAARDTPQVRRTVPSGVSAAATPRKEHGALPLPRSRTVSGGAPEARPQSHRRRNSVGGDLGDCATPRPFLRRGSGTGGAIGNLRSPRVHDLPSGSPSPRRPPQDQFVPKVAAGRHL
uniref:Uncharacterized protein n=1 Tax=Aegilops tauschii subsp. strangulata TaxID=200361 RepID=A0A453KUL9_AEGTS